MIKFEPGHVGFFFICNVIERSVGQMVGRAEGRSVGRSGGRMVGRSVGRSGESSIQDFSKYKLLILKAVTKQL